LIWIPQPGDLVGVKKMAIQGIVVASYETKSGFLIWGDTVGIAVVLVNGDQEEYAWSDLYHIPTDAWEPDE
jgi:hypothetical protein